jgi:hypothetical protein
MPWEKAVEYERDLQTICFATRRRPRGPGGVRREARARFKSRSNRHAADSRRHSACRLRRPAARPRLAPAVEGPSVVRVDGERLTDVSCGLRHARDVCEADDPAAALRADSQGDDIGTPCRHPGQTPTRDDARSVAALAAVADRPAGGEGGGGDLRHFDAGTGDRGAGTRRPADGRRPPRPDPRAGRRRSAPPEARLAGGDGAQGQADRGVAPGANIWKSASAPTPRSSPRPADVDGRLREPMSASTRPRPGTIPSPRSC